MPCIIETVTTPNQQDLLDLTKIYNDYPMPFNIDDLLKLINAKDIQVFAVRFNDRLIGGLSYQEKDGDAQLNHICVRAITRQRHVGRDLLRQVIQQTNAATITVDRCQKNEALDKLLQQAGFTFNNNSYVLTKQ